MKPINERLTELRETTKLSRQAFSNRIGIEQSTYSRYELGQTKPSFDTLEKIALCFPKISASWLLTGKGTMFTEGKPDVIASPVMNGVNPEELQELKKDRDMWREIAMTLAKSSSNAAGLLGKLEGDLDTAEIIAAFLRSQMRASAA